MPDLTWLDVCSECEDGHHETCFARWGDLYWCPCTDCPWLRRNTEGGTVTDFEPDPNMAYADFTMDCPTCGPATVVFKDGKQQPHGNGCTYVPPSLFEFEIGPEGFTSWPDGEPVNFSTWAEE